MVAEKKTTDLLSKVWCLRPAQLAMFPRLLVNTDSTLSTVSLDTANNTQVSIRNMVNLVTASSILSTVSLVMVNLDTASPVTDRLTIRNIQTVFLSRKLLQSA